MIKQVLIVVAVALITKNVLQKIHDYYYPQEINPIAATEIKDKVFTVEELKASKENGKLFLAILGKVYDVSSGMKHYENGGSYDFFVGIDGSRALVTGKFDKDLNDIIDDLSDSQIGDIFDWQSFYDKDYKYIGKLVGRFYDADGKPTQYLEKAEEALSRHQKVQTLKLKFNERFPGCNSEWSQDKGGLVRFWCTTSSGGIQRTWIGYPRKVHNSHTKTDQCACVNTEDLAHPSVIEYENCDSKKHECVFIK